MADHFSGPRAIADPAADIADLYVFPSPERPGYLVLVLTVFPAAAPGALFSDAVAYRFRLRPVTARLLAPRPAFEVGQDEYAFSCTFAAPAATNGSEAGAGGHMHHARASRSPSGRRRAGRLKRRACASLPGCGWIRSSSTCRAYRQPRSCGGWPSGHRPTISWTGQNVLSIVVEAEIAALFGAAKRPAVRGRRRNADDWQAPDPAGAHGPAGDKECRFVGKGVRPGEPRPRDSRFVQPGRPVPSGKDYVGAYRARLNANLAFFDGLDGKIDWPLDEQGNHPLTELLLADFLVVDVSKPYAEESCFEIERALLAGRAHATCGGRSLNDDIVDSLYTLLVNGGNGPRIRDGVDQATQPAARSFPYLVSPNPGPAGFAGP